jgi:hypothetical protein
MKRFAFVLCLLAPAVSHAEFVPDAESSLQLATVVEMDESQQFEVEGGSSIVFGRAANDALVIDRHYFGLSWHVRGDSGWSEVYAGPTWSPTPALTFGAGAGVETQTDETVRFRYALSLTAKSGPWLFIGSVEHNAGLFSGDNDGLWYDLNGLVTQYRPIVFGLKWRSDVGVGPYVEYVLPGGRFKVWVASTKIDPAHLSRGSHWSRAMFGLAAQF